MALGFIPLALVRMNLNALIQSQRSRALQNQYAALQEFYDYFRKNYINGAFPPRMWNVYNREMEFRTNNFVESFHQRWNNAVGVRHPSLWNFIRVLKAINETAIEGIRNGNLPPRTKRKWRNLE